MKFIGYISNLLVAYICMYMNINIYVLCDWQGTTVILSGPSGPHVTSVPSQNSKLVNSLVCLILFFYILI